MGMGRSNARGKKKYETTVTSEGASLVPNLHSTFCNAHHNFARPDLTESLELANQQKLSGLAKIREPPMKTADVAHVSTDFNQI